MSKLEVKFGVGITEPVKLGTVIVKLTTPSALSYAQNINVQNDEYGNEIAVPGPALTNITNNSELTGVVFASALYTTSGAGFLWFIEGLLGATNKLRKVENLTAGGTPQIDIDNLTVTDAAHTNVLLTDILVRDVTGTKTGFLIGKDDTDGWYKTFSANSGGAPIILTTQTLATFNTSREPKAIVASDNQIYIGQGYLIDKVSTADVYANNVISLKNDLGVTAMASWRLNLVVAWNSDFPHNFTTRNGAGSSGLVLWDLVPGTSWSTDYIICPSRYISAVVPVPSGHLIVFGGVDEGRCTLWEFTGYGYNKLVTYIGDLPRSKHSVDFDGQGRVVWLTADGQVCRYNLSTNLFEHLGSITTGSSAGGILRRALGATSNEFLVSSGTGTTYSLKLTNFGSYIGDGDVADGVTTPIVISGPVIFPSRATINNIELVLNGALVAGDNLELRLYRNGNTTPIAYGDDINSTNDGTDISSIRREQGEVDVSIAHVGVAFKAADARATSPGVIAAVIDYDLSE